MKKLNSLKQLTLFLLISFCSSSLFSQETELLKRSTLQKEEAIFELNYRFSDTTHRGFFSIKEKFSSSVKIISLNNCNAKVIGDVLIISGEKIPLTEFNVTIKASKEQFEISGLLSLENYPYTPKVITLEKLTRNIVPEKMGKPVTEVLGCTFSIQLAAARQSMDKSKLKALTGLDYEVREEQIDGYYKYTIGNFLTIKEADDQRKRIPEENFKKPFLVAYKDGVRVKLKQECD